MAQALSTLRQRVPLGSTDMAAALTEALACYGPAAPADGRGRAVVYIGDGMSTARLIAHGKFGQLVDGFVAAQRRLAASPSFHDWITNCSAHWPITRAACWPSIAMMSPPRSLETTWRPRPKCRSFGQNRSPCPRRSPRSIPRRCRRCDSIATRFSWAWARRPRRSMSA